MCSSRLRKLFGEKIERPLANAHWSLLAVLIALGILMLLYMDSSCHPTSTEFMCAWIAVAVLVIAWSNHLAVHPLDNIEKILKFRFCQRSADCAWSEMGRFFNKSYGYVIFPNVGKGGIGVGGATGNGTVYERGKIVGMAKMTQVSIGLQLGGQSYSEVVFFETVKEMKRFKENNIEFSAQVSA